MSSIKDITHPTGKAARLWRRIPLAAQILGAVAIVLGAGTGLYWRYPKDSLQGGIAVNLISDAVMLGFTLLLVESLLESDRKRRTQANRDVAFLVAKPLYSEALSLWCSLVAISLGETCFEDVGSEAFSRGVKNHVEKVGGQILDHQESEKVANRLSLKADRLIGDAERAIDLVGNVMPPYLHKACCDLLNSHFLIWMSATKSQLNHDQNTFREYFGQNVISTRVQNLSSDKDDVEAVLTNLREALVKVKAGSDWETDEIPNFSVDRVKFAYLSLVR